ncbi:MAG: hypothetical protein ACI9CF_000943 [Candidatus Omnitrophota bacterium]|jgi:hypothetical protein
MNPKKRARVLSRLRVRPALPKFKSEEKAEDKKHMPLTRLKLHRRLPNE